MVVYLSVPAAYMYMYLYLIVDLSISMYRDMVSPSLLEKLIVSGEEGVGTYRGTKYRRGWEV